MTDVRGKGAMLLRASRVFLCLLMLCSCDGTVMHGFSVSVGPSWERGEAVEYMFDGSARRYDNLDLSVEAIATASYRFKELAVRAEYLTAGDSLLGCDTFHIEVFNDEGRRTGATAGLLYQLKSQAKPVGFAVEDTLFIRLNHVMNSDTLKGITDVGIKLTNRKMINE